MPSTPAILLCSEFPFLKLFGKRTTHGEIEEQGDSHSLITHLCVVWELYLFVCWSTPHPGPAICLNTSPPQPLPTKDTQLWFFMYHFWGRRNTGLIQTTCPTPGSQPRVIPHRGPSWSASLFISYHSCFLAFGEKFICSFVHLLFEHSLQLKKLGIRQ